MSGGTRLNTLVEPVVTGLGYEFVGLERSGGRGSTLLRVYIDDEAGITVEDCERVSRQLSALFDVEDPIAGAYTLEVSSPGVERPLFTPEHYARFIGERVRVNLTQPQAGRRKLTGTLVEANAEGIVVEEDGEHYHVAFDDVERGRLKPENLPVSGARRAAT